MNRILFPILLALLSCGLFIPARAQENKVKIAIIGFYNLENLFDTIDSPDTDDKEFTPDGSSRWDSKKYATKLEHLASVISQIGDEYSKNGPLAMGLSEVENRLVVEDLVKTSPLAGRYGLVHYDSPDARGIDVSFIYRTDLLKILDSRPVKFTIPGLTDFKTRDILVVKGVFDGDTLWFMVNHWPSRSGGTAESAFKRNAAGDLCRKTADSIMKLQPGAKIIIMGDLNDDPVDASLMDHLKTQVKPDKVKAGDLFNPSWQLFRDGTGSLAYRDTWNLFDQVIVSAGLMDKSGNDYYFYKAKIFNRKFLIQKEGQYAGYPYRTYGGGVYEGGYSDHLPAYIAIVKEIK
jgi:hypothetical protein